MTYGRYLRELIRFTISTTVALAIVLSLALSISGGTTANIDLTLEVGRFDGLWFILLLPLVVGITLLLVSPLAWFINNWLPSRKPDQP